MDFQTKRPNQKMDPREKALMTGPNQQITNSRKMIYLNLQNKVKELLFCPEQDYLIICLEKGVLINLALELSFQGVVSQGEEIEKTLAWVSDTTEVRLDRALLQTEGNLLV